MLPFLDTYTDCSRGERDKTHFHTFPTGESLFLLVEGSESGWDIGYQPMIDLVKQSVSSSFDQHAGSTEQRLLQAITVADTQIRQRFPKKDDLDHNRYATLLAGVVTGNQASLAWVGLEQAKLFRNKRCLKETAPHKFVHGALAITTKYLSAVHLTTPKPDLAGPWDLEKDDILVIADFALFRVISDVHIAEIVDGERHCARRLVELAQQLEERFAQTAMVIRMV
jgi:hypothetical protein